MANNTSLYGSNGNVLPAGDNVIITGTLTVNGCAILTDCSTFNLLPFNATTVNIGGSATTLALGATTGVTTVRNQLAADNITVTGSTSGSSTFNPPATGSTLVYTLPGASGAASTVLTNNGSGVLSWALPGGGGSTFGNITIAIDTDNTISTTTGDLILQTQAGVNSGVITIEAGAGNDVVIEPNGAGRVLLTTNQVVVGDLNVSAAITTNGTGGLYLNTNGYTNSGQMFMEAGVNGNIVIAPYATGTGAVKTYNDFIVDDDVLFVDVSTKKIGINNIVPAYDLDVTGSGRFTSTLIASGSLTLNGTTSGYSNFAQSAAGPNINYVLPTAQGAASTTLTNDGSGNLSWALPGGGGSTFGNITIAVVDDNTISTTTGNLVLDSNNNLVNVTADLVVNNNLAVNGGDITTTALTANIFTTNATQINIGTAGDGTLANGGVIDLGISGQTFNVDVNAVALTQNGTTSQVTTKNLNITQTTPLEVMNTTRKAMKGFVTVTDDVTGAIHSIAFLAIRKTSTANAYITIYAEIFSDAPLATFTVTDSTGSLRLFATPLSLNSTDITIMRHSLGD